MKFIDLYYYCEYQFSQTPEDEFPFPIIEIHSDSPLNDDWEAFAFQDGVIYKYWRRRAIALPDNIVKNLFANGITDYKYPEYTKDPTIIPSDAFDELKKLYHNYHFTRKFNKLGEI